MRQQPTSTALSTLIAALPIERLAALVVELARNGSAASAPAAVADPQPAKRQHKGWPRGKLRGPRKMMLKKAEAAAKTEAKAKRAAERKRERRAEARALREAGKAAAEVAKTGVVDANVVKPSTGSNGPNNSAGKKGEAAKLLWEHARLLDTKCPWRPVADEFSLNRQAVLDSFRSHSLPVGIGADAVERFLELPVE